MKAALVQMEVVDGDPAANQRKAESLISGSPEAKLYLLPELWTTGYAHGSWPEAARGWTPRHCAWLQGLAEKRRAWIAGSMVSLDEGGRLVNRLWVFGPQGPPVHYDKGHLFQPMREHLHLAAGPGRVRMRVGPFEAGLSICFDLRFPEMYRRDAVEGAELFLVSAEWPHPRGEAMRALARARAIENQAYLLLVNRVGPSSDGTVFCGGSMAVGPEGSLLAEAGESECVVTATLDPGAARGLRSQFPVLGLRVPGLDY
jgi:predicted amidohydrolase